MSKTIVDQIESVFGSPDNFSKEGMNELLYEVFKTFNELKEKLASPDEKERQEALEMGKNLKLRLEEQALALCKMAGVDPGNLDSYINNSSNFSAQEWQTLQDTKSELDSFKKDLIADKK